MGISKTSTAVVFTALARPEDIKADIKPKRRAVLWYAFGATTYVTNNSIEAAEQITEEIVMTAGNPTPQELLNAITAFQIIGIVLSALYFLYMPARYFYHYLRGEPVPCTTSNNVKWALSGAILTLSVVSLTVPAAGAAVLCAFAALGVLHNAYTLGKYIYRRANIKKRIDDNKLQIQVLEQQIHYDLLRVNEHRSALANIKQNPALESKILHNLEILHTQHQKHCDELRAAKNLKQILKVENFKLSLTYKPVSLTLQFVLALAFAIGTILTLIPPTALIGATILAVVAAVGLLAFTVNKIQQSWQRSHSDKILAGEKPIVDTKILSPAPRKTSEKVLAPLHQQKTNLQTAMHVDDQHEIATASLPMCR